MTTLAPLRTASDLDHISYSGMTTYQTCPRKFAYKYLDDDADEEFLPSSLVFGGAFHRTVEFVQQAQLEGTDIPDADELLAVFDGVWDEETTDKPSLRFSKDETPESVRELAKRMFVAYREHVVSKNEDTQILAIEHAHRFRLMANVPAIEMRIDLLELRGTDLIVTDFKTSKSRWNETRVAESLPQLVLYSHGLLPLVKELGATRLVPRFIVISKAKKPVVQVLEPQANQADADALKRTVGETWQGIERGEFKPRSGWHCALCPFQNRCLG